MIETITELTGKLAGILWNNGLTMLILVGTGLYLTIRLRFVQLTGFRHGWTLISGKLSHDTDVGEVSHFQALSTALSATVGTGNIAGVATAISLGGPGALFWMWVTAFVGMATKFTESTLALKFREVDSDGTVAGGPMYTLLHGLKMKRMAALFAVFALVASFGIGNMVQANSVVDGLTYIWPEFEEQGWMIGVVLSLLVGMVILGGVHRIAVVASAIVPFMVIIYLVSALVVLVQNGTAHWAHAGDSRLYLVRGGRVLTRTTDHSYVERLRQQGIITEQQQEKHPQRNYVTRCLGGKGNKPEFSHGSEPLQPGDVLMLCSDGLWGSLDEVAIVAGLGASEPMAEVTRQLAEAAAQQAHPESDNVTVIALRIVEPGGAEPARDREAGEPRPAGDDLASAVAELQNAILNYELESKQEKK